MSICHPRSLVVLSTWRLIEERKIEENNLKVKVKGAAETTLDTPSTLPSTPALPPRELKRQNCMIIGIEISKTMIASRLGLLNAFYEGRALRAFTVNLCLSASSLEYKMRC